MTALEKALVELARLHGTSLEHEVARFYEDLIERRARMKVKPALTEEERAAREKASRQRSRAKAKVKTAAACALKPVPTAEELAAKEAERKARHNAYHREYMRKVRGTQVAP